MSSPNTTFLLSGVLSFWEEGLPNSKGKKKSYLKNPPYFLLKNGLRLWHEDMLWVSQIGWEAELLEGLKKRKSSWLHGAYALLLGQLFLSDQAR